MRAQGKADLGIRGGRNRGSPGVGRYLGFSWLVVARGKWERLGSS